MGGRGPGKTAKSPKKSNETDSRMYAFTGEKMRKAGVKEGEGRMERKRKSRDTRRTPREAAVGVLIRNAGVRLPGTLLYSFAFSSAPSLCLSLRPPFCHVYPPAFPFPLLFVFFLRALREPLPPAALTRTTNYSFAPCLVLDVKPTIIVPPRLSHPLTTGALKRARDCPLFRSSRSSQSSRRSVSPRSPSPCREPRVCTWGTVD